jgi:hypothetical protein
MLCDAVLERAAERAGCGLVQREPVPLTEMPAQTPRLLAHVKGRMRARPLRPRTARAYVGWIIRHRRYR